MERSAIRGKSIGGIPRVSLRFTRATRLCDLNRRRHRHVIRGPLPAARVLGNVEARDTVAELRRDPDVVEAAPAVSGFPVVHRPIAPPCIELCGLGRQLACDVDPVADLAKAVELFGLDWCV